MSSTSLVCGLWTDRPTVDWSVLFGVFLSLLGPPETKKPEQHPQKYPLWLPWLMSLLLLLVCIALVVVLLGKYVQGDYKGEVWGEYWEKSRETMLRGCLGFV